MKYIINAAGIVFFHQNKPIKIDKSSPQYLRVVKVFDLPESEQEQAVIEILDQAAGNFERDGFKITPDEVIYNGESMPRALADKIRAIAQEGLPVSIFAKFWDNLQLNPSANSVRELYDFLAYKELPITEDGYFLAYKGLTKDGWSISGNKETKVLKGKVDNAGRIFNGLNEEIEVRRWDVDDNRQNHCSYGLHVGSLDYAQGFAQGQVVVVKVNPKDVVSVPEDCDCQKCRVSAYKVIDIFSKEIECPVCDEDGEEILDEEEIEYNEFEKRIDNYLIKKSGGDPDLVSVRAIQNSFSPEYPSKVRVLDALNTLGYTWIKDEDGNEQVLI
jgi:hypothetical protein